MFEKVAILQIAQAMASHAALRQSAISQNIANADTPGYAARDVAPFAETYAATSGGAMRANRPEHMAAQGNARATVSLRSENGSMSPNGNSVSLEDEMVKAVEVKRQHDLALAIYKTSLGVLRSGLGRR
ncbi:MAG: FlgB family protein [Rhodobacteraceae bacterium]|nr:FlgB family protein [Paracoccaceae bacterium]